MSGARRDLCRDLLQVKEGASARRAADELRLRVAHAASLQQAERNATCVVHWHSICLHANALPESVDEASSNLAACADHELVNGHLAVLVQCHVHHGHVESTRLDELKGTAHRVHAAALRSVSLRKKHRRSRLGRLAHRRERLERRGVLHAVEAHGEALASLRQRRRRAIERGKVVHRHRTVHRVGGQRRLVADHVHVALHQPAECAPELGIRRRRHATVREINAVDGGNVLERHAHNRLASEVGVQLALAH
mmetsp:Transcript_8313/g.18987  ORF Transcript_8313/g.18987 Transcript_8313/m.18987 type:complete len:252 (+) Transcript_8313:377-1132(+)